MRIILSLFFMAAGLAAVYLFSTGALAVWSQSGFDWQAGLEKVRRPLDDADTFTFLALSAGLMCFAFGVLVAPRAEMWLSRQGGADASHPGRHHPPHETREVWQDAVLQVFLAFSALVVAALLCLLGLSFTTGRSPGALGAIFLVAAFELFLGLGMAGKLLFAPRFRPRTFRPVMALSTGILVLELAAMGAVLGLAWVR